MDKNREQFEAWWLYGVYPLRRMDRFEDAGVSEELAQEIWQASRESLVIEVPDFDEWPASMESEMRNAFRNAIEAAGLKVKP